MVGTDLEFNKTTIGLMSHCGFFLGPDWSPENCMFVNVFSIITAAQIAATCFKYFRKLLGVMPGFKVGLR